MVATTIPTHGALQGLRSVLADWDNAGLTVTQMRVLLVLEQQDGASNAFVAGELGLSRPSVSALLDRLERGRFIRRELSKRDRRAIEIWMEDRGREIVAEAARELTTG